MPTILLAIFAGGCIGATTRYAVHSAIHARISGRFPAATLVINTAGSFLLGLALPPLHDAAPPALTALVTVGFLSAFTTFSTFAWDILTLLESRRRIAAAAYIAGGVCAGVLAVGAGYALAS
jgi:fluoride exporter